MPYKVARIAAAKRQKKHREGVTKGVTSSEGVTQPSTPEAKQGVTLEEIRKALGPKLSAEFEAKATFRGEPLLPRFQRAYEYHLWNEAGRPLGRPISLQNDSPLLSG